MIVKRGGKYHLFSEDGKKHLGGPYATRYLAEVREDEVRAAKSAKGKS